MTHPNGTLSRRTPALDHIAAHEADPAPLHLVALTESPVPRTGHPQDSLPESSLPQDILSLANATLDDMKAEETVVIDLMGRTSIADAMIITSGRSQRHVGSIADKLVQNLKLAGHKKVRVEGVPACDWVLIDAGDLIVHIFRPDVRGFYNLEKIWGVDRPVERAAPDSETAA